MVILDEAQTDQLINDAIRQNYDLANWEREAVRRGARLLDEIIIKWWEKIDTDKLSLDSGTNDILGQLFGSYYGALQELKIDEAANYGFDSRLNPDGNSNLETSWKRIEGYWKAEIVERFHSCC